MEYRYMIWNDIKKEFQFPRICETNEKGATTCLFNCIGNDARKDRFQIKKVEKERGKQMIEFLVGLFIGTFIGITIMCILQVSKDNEE